VHGGEHAELLRLEPKIAPDLLQRDGFKDALCEILRRPPPFELFDEFRHCLFRVQILRRFCELQALPGANLPDRPGADIGVRFG
jgi:hypothetical protein